MTKSVVRALPIAEWPAADRAAWEHACRPSERLKRGGRASHLKVVTRDDLARRYGYFLDYLARRRSLDLTARAAAHVTPANAEGYHAEMRARGVSSVTQYGQIYKLRRTAELLEPTRDLGWLKEIENDLELAQTPHSKFGRAPLTEVLVSAGLTLMAEAEAATHLTPLKRARQFRNGLMVALLALCPIRLKNFSSLAIGRSFVEVAGQWWIVLAAAETKEARADERPVPNLSAHIERYLAEHRPVLARGGELSGALWLSGNDGKAMRYCSVAAAIEETTLRTLGVRVSPHMFRTSGASSAAIHAPQHPRLGSAVLHHTDRRITDEHYVRVTSMSAAQDYMEIINTYLT